MKFFFTIFILFISFLGFSQVQISSVNQGETTLDAKPYFGVDFGIPFNIIGPYSPVRDETIYSETGIYISNRGISYIEGNNQFIHRTLGINIPLRVGLIVNKVFYLGVGNNFNFPFHYKLKNIDIETNIKTIEKSEFFSERTNWFYPNLEFSAGVSIHRIGRFSVRLQMNYMNFFNTDYSETIENYEIKPYENLLINRHWNIVIGYNPGL